MSLTLALESSSPRSSWVLLEGDHPLAEGQTEERASGALFSTLARNWPTGAATRPERILVGVGPGSFSGIRVSLAAALGLSRVWGCPILPLRSTHAIAQIHPDIPRLGLYSDAKRGQLFQTIYEFGKMTQPSHLISKESLTEQVRQCSLALALAPLDGFARWESPQAVELYRSWREGGYEPGLPLEPIYLHASIVPSPPSS